MSAIRSLIYDDSSHYKVVTQLYGSVWPKVLPICIVNALLTAGVWLLKRHGIDITSDPSGHKYMATLMSFLVVTRVKVCYSVPFCVAQSIACFYDSDSHGSLICY